MSEQDLSTKVLQQLEEKQAEPKPKWEFQIKNITIWVLGVLSVLVGAVAVSIITFSLRNNEWDLFEKFAPSRVQFFFTVIPYFWVLLFVIFIILADQIIKQTKKGYKYRLSAIIAITLFSSIGLGLFLYDAGIGRRIDDSFQNGSELYAKVLHNRQDRWVDPEHGVLAGVVVKVVSPAEFVIKDFNQKDWQVLSDNEAVRLEQRVKLIGEITGDMVFSASEIRPWIPERPPLKRIKSLIERNNPALRNR